jgi:hypothetical protein
MNYLLTCFCFDMETLNGRNIAGIIEEGLGFVPSEVKTNDFFKAGARYTDGVLKRIASSDRISEVRLQTDAGPAGPYFQVISIGTWGFQAVYWRVPSLDVPSRELCERLTDMPGFNAGYRCAADDVFWQSETNPATYELYDRPHKNLPKVIDPATGEPRIDIRANPGRRTPFPGMWLQSCWQMWFGRGAFARLPMSRLRSFPGAEVNKRLKSGAVFIQLYSDPFSYDSSTSRTVQTAFREWSGMNELEERALEAGAREIDPSFEIREGVFPHGGVRLLTEWLDERDNPTRRSRAAKRVDVELDAEGRELWSATAGAE